MINTNLFPKLLDSHIRTYSNWNEYNEIREDIEQDYIDSDFTPLKCRNCNSVSFENKVVGMISDNVLKALRESDKFDAVIANGGNILLEDGFCTKKIMTNLPMYDTLVSDCYISHKQETVDGNVVDCHNKYRLLDKKRKRR